MTLKRKCRFIIVPAASAALVLGLARCTPLNPSMAKSMLRPSSEGGALTVIKPSSAKASPGSTQTPAREQVASFKTQVVDRASFNDLRSRYNLMRETEDLPSVQMIELNQEQLEDLREFRQTPIAMGDEAPSEAEVIVSIQSTLPKLTRSELANFSMELKHRDNGAWELVIPRNPDSERERTADTVLKNLDNVMISVRVQQKEAAPDSPEVTGTETGERAKTKKPVRRPLGLEPRIHSVNAIRSLETSRRLLSLISASQAL